MRLILLGPPGGGKGTQAKLLSQRNHLEHIGTGDLLREAIRQNTPTGALARPFVEAGKLAPDELVNALVAERFARDDRPKRFVMDGYPRTVAQAAMFDAVLRQWFLPLSAVVLMTVADEEIVRRLARRKREDDKEETVRTRLVEYHKNTEELIPHYRAQGLLREVSGEGEIEQVYCNLMKALNPQAGHAC
jgi:adenylate kinase